MKMKRNSFRATFREIFIAIFVVICILFVGLVFFNKSDQKQPTQTVVQEGPRELTVYGIAGILDVLREIGWPDPMDLVGVLCDTIEVDSLTFWLVRIDMDNEDALGVHIYEHFAPLVKKNLISIQNFSTFIGETVLKDGLVDGFLQVLKRRFENIGQPSKNTGGKKALICSILLGGIIKYKYKLKKQKLS